MKKIFKEWGGTIIVVIAIVALIGLVTLLMQPGGLMEGAFSNIVQSFVDKTGDLVSGSNTTELKAGLYDENDNLVADWDTLVNSYGLNVEENYTYESYATSTGSGYYVLNNYDELSAGVKLIIGDGVTTIGEYSFAYCRENLTSIVFPESLVSIDDYAFFVCSRLESVSIPEGVTSIGAVAFRDCKNLTSVTLPASLTSIGTAAFSNCAFESVTIPSGVESIGASAFGACANLTSVEIASNVSKIGAGAFSFNNNLSSISVSSDNGVYHSDNNCLIETASKTLVAGCKTSVIPTDGSVTNIGKEAFKGLTSLTSTHIPESVTNIGNSAYKQCSKLKSIHIPEGVINIDFNAFASCSALETISFGGTMEQWNAITFGNYWNDSIPATQVYCVGDNAYVNIK